MKTYYVNKISTALLLASACFFLNPLKTYANERSTWTLDKTLSRVAYASIKNNEIGEVNHFKQINGNISEGGIAKIDIDLSSVETRIPIRNERVIEHIFGKENTVAKIEAIIDPDKLSALEIGESMELDISANFIFSNKNIPITTKIFITRLNQSRLLATSNDMVIVNTDTLGINSGITMLEKLAGLKSITRAIPITLRLAFNKKQKALSGTSD